MAQDEKQSGQQVSDSIISEFGTYQEFLDSQITRKDLYYLEVSITGIIIDMYYVCEATRNFSMSL